jgi:hypothetical protein
MKDLQDFKDQVARDEATIPGTKLRDWTDWKGFKDKMHTLGYGYEQWSDRAATLFAEHERKEGYEEGKQVGLNQGRKYTSTGPSNTEL